MMRKPPFGFCLLGVAMTSLLGCEAVPTLFFPGADADAAAVSTVDADAGSTDGAGDIQDDAVEVGCPLRPPPGTSACCGVVPCNGDCEAGCPQCEVKCKPMGQQSTVCCARSTATCHPPQSGFVCN